MGKKGVKGICDNTGRTHFKKGIRNNPSGEFKKGHIPWHKKDKIKKLCAICEKEFYVRNYRKNTAKYCSHKCQNKGMINSQGYWLGKKRPMMTGKRHPRWKDEIVSTQGYVFIKQPSHPRANISGNVKKANLVVEKFIKRFLLPPELVHHRGKRDNDRPHMLMAFVNNSAHKRFHHNPNSVKPSEIIFDGRNL